MTVARRVYERVQNPHSDAGYWLRYATQRTLDVDVEDYTLTFDTTSVPAKRWFYPRYADGSQHEPVVSAAFIQQVSPDSTVIDVGAHVGYYTVLAAVVADEGAVHAFELDPRLVPTIDSHFAAGRNDGAAPVRVVCGAVGDSVGAMSTFSPVQSRNRSTNLVDDDADPESGIAAPMTTLDDYCSRVGLSPDVLKVDVEGYEAHVIEGAGDVLETVDALFLEVHPDGLDRVGRSMSALVADLDTFGFAIHRFADHRAETKVGKALTPLEDVETLDENTMLICSR